MLYEMPWIDVINPISEKRWGFISGLKKFKKLLEIRWGKEKNNPLYKKRVCNSSKINIRKYPFRYIGSLFSEQLEVTITHERKTYL